MPSERGPRRGERTTPKLDQGIPSSIRNKLKTPVFDAAKLKEFLVEMDGAATDKEIRFNSVLEIPAHKEERDRLYEIIRKEGFVIDFIRISTRDQVKTYAVFQLKKTDDPQ